ncbi:hypothetical protein [Planococcus lenghuensis]|nr:hypothetical protein [Planococcus lenghuensis]
MSDEKERRLEAHMEQLIKMTALLHRRLSEAERELRELKSAPAFQEIRKV